MKKIIVAGMMLWTTGALAMAHKHGGVYLLVQTADVAEVVAVANHPNTYQLTLKNVSPYVTCFSDRPVRKSQPLSLDKFSQDWQKVFVQDAPNADLVGVQTGVLHHQYLNYSIELSTMHYDAARHTFQYVVHVLKGSKPFPGKMELHNAALFIDGVCLTCIG